MPAVYRYDISPNKRAGCQSAQCKAAEIKIQKGELRFATLVTINEHDSWKYKHWGCVTPLQISNIIEQIGGLDGLDLDNDLDILDGYEELEPWAQAKIKFALQNGHVEDEDWKGDPELNRPGQKGITKKRTPKKKKKTEEEDENQEDDEDASPSKPKAKKRRGKAKVENEDDESPAPQKKTAGRKRKAAENVDDSESTEEKKPKKRGTRKPKTQAMEEEHDSDQPARKLPKKRGRKPKGADDAEVSNAEDQAQGYIKPEPENVNKKTKVEAPTVKKVGKSRKVKEEEDSAGELAEEPSKAAKKKTTRKTSGAAVKDELAEVESQPVKGSRARSRKPKEAATDTDVVMNDEAVNNVYARTMDDEEEDELPQERKKRTRSKRTKVEAE